MKKHPQFILAASSALTASLNLKQGLNRLPYTLFLEHAQSHLAIREREHLEKNPAYRQLLPYLIISTQGIDGKIRYITYQRGKGVGEARLAGNYSIGFGGHVDLADIRFKNSVIHLDETLIHAAEREVLEELKFLNSPTKTTIHCTPFHIIMDNSNAVGEVHLGLVFEMKIAPETIVESNEEELILVGAKTKEELLSSGIALENWTKIYLDAQYPN
jgi:predicted NUDIX family phosphoesterase